MAYLDLFPVWLYFPPYTLLQTLSFAIIIKVSDLAKVLCGTLDI